MLKIKLTPTGKRNELHYRIVVVEAHSKITGSPAAVLGHYHPSTGQMQIDTSSLSSWLQKGAQPTQRIRRLLKKTDSIWKTS